MTINMLCAWRYVICRSDMNPLALKLTNQCIADVITHSSGTLVLKLRFFPIPFSHFHNPHPAQSIFKLQLILFVRRQMCMFQEKDSLTHWLTDSLWGILTFTPVIVFWYWFPFTFLHILLDLWQTHPQMCIHETYSNPTSLFKFRNSNVTFGVQMSGGSQGSSSGTLSGHLGLFVGFWRERETDQTFHGNTTRSPPLCVRRTLL